MPWIYQERQLLSGGHRQVIGKYRERNIIVNIHITVVTTLRKLDRLVIPKIL